jgi:transposase-like protein
MPTLPQTGAPHKLAEGDWAAALEADMQAVVRRAIEHIVDAELTALLGPRYAWDAARVGYRHGTKVRTVTSPVGAVTVTVPRARLQTPITGRAEWESQVLPAYARRMRQVNAALLQVSSVSGYEQHEVGTD